jgi:tripartite-type tricarboxylate transporter receptor subunit TctC
MKLPRRRFLYLAAGTAALPAMSRMARAQTYPVRPVRIIVGFPAGGVSDVFGRLIGQWLSERLGQSFVIENRPGASGTIALDSVACAAPDGYTLLLTSGNDPLSESLYGNVRFNYIRNISPIAGIAVSPNVMEVNPIFPAKTVPEFIDYAKANPSKINFGSAGIGTGQHLCGELFKMTTGIDMLHVPYRGGAPAIADLLGGQVQVMFDFLTSSIEYIRAGRLRALAVLSAIRLALLPEIATMSEFIPGFEAGSWFGVGAPRSTPAVIIDMLNREINAGLTDPRLKARVADLGAVTLQGSTAEFVKFIATDAEKWVKVIRTANIRL